MKQRTFLAGLILAGAVSISGTAFAGANITLSKTLGNMTITANIKDSVNATRILYPPSESKRKPAPPSTQPAPPQPAPPHSGVTPPPPPQPEGHRAVPNPNDNRRPVPKPSEGYRPAPNMHMPPPPQNQNPNNRPGNMPPPPQSDGHRRPLPPRG